jgi:hypothetical protein
VTCALMLDQMLEADLPELDGVGDSALAVHVRRCARCRAVADQIAGDTRELASLVKRSRDIAAESTPPARSVATRSYGIAAVALAAALSFVAVRTWSPNPTTNAPNAIPRTAVAPGASNTPAVSAPTPATTATSAPAARRPNQPDRVRSSRNHASAPTTGRSTTAAPHTPSTLVLASTPSAVRVEPVLARPVGPTPTVDPVRLEAVPGPPLGNRVRVDPPVGTRARVMRTANPGVTVIWLYESISTGPQP